MNAHKQKPVVRLISTLLAGVIVFVLSFPAYAGPEKHAQAKTETSNARTGKSQTPNQVLPFLFAGQFQALSPFNSYTIGYAPIPWMSGSEYTETPFRRGEIIFFLALPFVALANILAFSAGYYLYDPTYNFSIASMPPLLLGAMGLSTLTFTILIVIDDANRNKKNPDSGSDSKLMLGVSSRL